MHKRTWQFVVHCGTNLIKCRIWTVLIIFYWATFEIGAADLVVTNKVATVLPSVTNVVIGVKLKTIKGRYESGSQLEEKDVRLKIAFAVSSDGIKQLGEGTLHGYVPIPEESGLGYSQILKSISTDIIKEKTQDEIVEKKIEGKSVKVRTGKWRVVVFSGYTIWTTILTEAKLEPAVALELGVVEAEGKPVGTMIQPLLGATYSKARRVKSEQMLVFEEPVKEDKEK